MGGLSACELDVAGERVALRGDGTLFWPRHGLLAVDDVHLGKTESYRAHGVALPDGVMHDDLVRLAAAVEDTGARRLVVIGDLIHDAAGVTGVVRESLLRWRQTIPCVLDLVLGNHDRRLKVLPEEWQLAIHDPCLRIAPFVFAGVQILKPELFADTPDGAFSTNLIWDRLLETERLYGMRHDGLWFHVGTPASIAGVEERLEVQPHHAES